MRIVFADDHALMRDALRATIADLQPNVQLLEAGNFPDALALLEAHDPVDLCLLDLRMPGMEPIPAVRLIRRRWPELRLAVLSAITDRETLLGIIALGVAAYIPKQMNIRSMLSALQLVLAGERFIPTRIWTREEKPAEAEAVEGPEVPFTQREVSIIRLLRDGLPNKAIARQLNIAEVTVKSHLYHIFQKLGVQNRVQAARACLDIDV
jgi:DNA-binding NarL/FixJ family response regulator